MTTIHLLHLDDNNSYLIGMLLNFSAAQQEVMGNLINLFGTADGDRLQPPG